MKPATRLEKWYKRELTPEEDQAPAGSECPCCGECEMDRLVWDSYEDKVTCVTCNTTYKP